MVVGGTYSDAERLQGYSDAVLGIVATLLVVPLMKLDEGTKKELLVEKSLEDVLLSGYRLRSFALYYVSFIIVFQCWVWHGRQFYKVEHVDALMLFANWSELLGISILPFTVGTAANANALAAEDPKKYLQLETPLYLNILVIALAHLSFQLLLWWSKPSGEFDFFRIVESVFVSAPCLVAYLLAVFEIREAYIPYFFLPFIQIFVWYKYANVDKRIRDHFRQASIQGEQSQLLIENSNDDYNSNENGSNGTIQTSKEDLYLLGVTKRRFEVFTDGVIAIAATLIVLDIQPMSDCKELKDPLSCAVHWDDGCRPGLSKKLSFECYFEVGESKEKNLYLMFSYAFCFAIVNVFWAQHHYIFDRVYSEGKGKITSLTLILNLHFCIAVSMLPFSCNLMTEYAIKPFKNQKNNPSMTLTSSYGEFLAKLHPDESAGRTACLFTTALLFLASVFLFGLLIEQKSVATPPFVILRYLSVPIITFIAMILLGTEVEGVLYKPLLVIPPMQLGWSVVELCLVRGKNASVQQGSYIHIPGVRSRDSNRNAAHLLDPNDYEVQQTYETQQR